VLPTVSIADLTAAPDVVIVPGHGAGERLAANQDAVTLVKSAHAAGSVIGALGTGVSVLEAAGIDVSAAEKVVTAGGADDLPAFVKAIRGVLDAAR
jgi:putative intracellular protease/amidase